MSAKPNSRYSQDLSYFWTVNQRQTRVWNSTGAVSEPNQ